MPIVLCKYCEYVGSGDDLEDQWEDVRNHELKKHPEEVKEEE
jgi:hypothetical protein